MSLEVCGRSRKTPKGWLAQWLERSPHTREVTGSNPVPPTRVSLPAEVAERKTRYVQGVVPLAGVWVRIPPSAPNM